MVLFTELFVDNKESNIKFIESNLSSNFFTKIVVFVDEKTESFVIHPMVVKIKKRLSSMDLFEFKSDMSKQDLYQMIDYIEFQNKYDSLFELLDLI